MSVCGMFAARTPPVERDLHGPPVQVDARLARTQRAGYGLAVRVVSRFSLLGLAVAGLLSCDSGDSATPDDAVWGVPASQAGAPDASQAEAPAPMEVEEPEPPAFDPIYAEVSQKLAKHIEGNTHAWDRLAYMSDMFGHRLSGSKALEDTIDWTIEEMKKDGLQNARREKVMVPHWVRGKESARVVAPVKRDLVLLGLGGTVGTGRRGITAEIATVANLAEIDEKGDALEGKIVVINQAMPDYDHERHDAGYGKTVRIRSSGASRAAKYGAKAVLIRSVTAHSLRTPHTGALRYDEGVKKIPAAALTPADTEFLVRMAERGPTKVQLKLGAKTLKDAESANAIAELVGREKPEEVVVIGGHIDSWDVGDGATDDGSGCVMAMEAARMLKALDIQPKRTIRVVLFTNEENGLRGGNAYKDAHKGEVHAGGIESDSGSGAPWGIGIGGSEEQVAALQKYRELFEPFDVFQLILGGGGADIGPMMREGMLGLSIRPDTSHYFDLHHSPADTVDKIRPMHIQKNAAAMAMMAFILAERDEIDTVAKAEGGGHH